MSKECCAPPSTPVVADPRYRRVLWIALLANAVMFAGELVAGVAADSVSLLADAIDFAGDAANYGLSLAVLAMSALARARAALLKGVSMGLFGIGVLVHAVWSAATGSSPEAYTMGAVAIVACAVNLGVATMLYRWRAGDANMRSVWLCSRNDALGNLAVLGAAWGVHGSGSAWPDLAVAALMAALALSAAVSVVRRALMEMASDLRGSRADTHSR